MSTDLSVTLCTDFALFIENQTNVNILKHSSKEGENLTSSTPPMCYFFSSRSKFRGIPLCLHTVHMPKLKQIPTEFKKKINP